MKIAPREKALIGIALAVAGFVAFGPSGSNTVEPARAPAAADATPPPEPVERAAFGEPPPVGGIMTRLAHRVAGAAADAALFATHSWYTPPPPPPPTTAAAIVVAPPVPTAPPLPFAYMGSYRRAGGKQVYFVTRNDRIYDVSAGDTLDGVYTFEGLSGPNLVFTYKPLKMRQTLAVDGDP